MKCHEKCRTCNGPYNYSCVSCDSSHFLLLDSSPTGGKVCSNDTSLIDIGSQSDIEVLQRFLFIRNQIATSTSYPLSGFGAVCGSNADCHFSGTCRTYFCDCQDAYLGNRCQYNTSLVNNLTEYKLVIQRMMSGLAASGLVLRALQTSSTSGTGDAETIDSWL